MVKLNISLFKVYNGQEYTISDIERLHEVHRDFQLFFLSRLPRDDYKMVFQIQPKELFVLYVNKLKHNIVLSI